MKQWMMMVVIVMSMVVVLPSAAQDGGALAYGDSVTGEITDEVWEVTYSFDGKAGDLIMITMVAEDFAFDGYLYLRDSSGSVVAENDDGVGLDPRLIIALPSTDSYTIVAARLDGPDGTGTGAFRLSISQVNMINLGVAYEGQFELEGDYPVLAFMVPDAGFYAVSYTQTGGEGHPNFEVNLLEGVFTTNLIYMSANKLQQASVVTELEGFLLYIFELTPNYFEWEAAGTVSFTVQIDSAQ